MLVEDEPEEGVDLTSVSVVIEEDDIVASKYHRTLKPFRPFRFKDAPAEMNNFTFPTQIDTSLGTFLSHFLFCLTGKDGFCVYVWKKLCWP